MNNFEVVLSHDVLLSPEIRKMLGISEQYKKAGMEVEGNRLELQAAFTVCEKWGIPIYKNKRSVWHPYEQVFNGESLQKRGYDVDVDKNYECYNKYMYCWLSSLADYQEMVPQRVLNKLHKIKKKHYPSIYIAALTKIRPSHYGSQPLCLMEDIDLPALSIGEETTVIDADPVLLYRFNYYNKGAYYMELDRWE